MGRSPCCEKSKVKRGSWSPQEDAILKNYIQSHGTGGNWITLPLKAGLKRCGKSCRLRWLNYLRPDIKIGGFTQDEEYIICNLYNQIGSRWSAIASQLPGRTDNDVKNYWNTKLKKKFMATKSDVENAPAAAAGAQIAPPAPPSSYPPESVASVPIKFSPSKLSLEGSSDCLSGGNNGVNLPFCPSQFQHDSSPVTSFCMGMDGSGEVKMDEFSWEILSEIWSQEEVVGADVDADLFSVFHFDSKPHGVNQNH